MDATERTELDPKPVLDFPLGLSRWGWDTCPRPRISAALHAFDSSLLLVWDKENPMHVVLRMIPRKVHYNVSGFGRVVWFEYPVVHICNWPQAIVNDNPDPLIEFLKRGDIYEHPELIDGNPEVDAIEERVAAQVRDLWHHAFRENRRILGRAWDAALNGIPARN